MLKPLTFEGRIEIDLDAKMAGKVYAFTPVVREGYIGLGIAVANESGYLPVPQFFCYADRWDEMSAHADELNRALGLDDRSAARVVASTMAAQNARGRRIDGQL